MASAREKLTELEGAILTEVACRGNDTAYKIRRAMQLRRLRVSTKTRI